MRVFVTGASGMLGQTLVKTLERDFDLYAFSHGELDITDLIHLRKKIEEISPSVIINAAAYTKVDKAEEERTEAFKVNALGVYNLCVVCSDSSIELCHISTDYVFDGSSDRPYTPFDNPNPINYYGQTKLAGERYIQWLLRRFYIVRTSWLYGEGGKNFVNTILRLAGERDEIRVVNDQRGSPTSTVTLSEGIVAVIKRKAYGIHHITDRTDGGISWYEFAKEIVKQKGLNCRVVPISTKEYPTSARRPCYSVLDTFFTEVTSGFKPPDWKESLKRYLSR